MAASASTSGSSDNWNKDEVVRLIELFEQETVLWDVKLSSHKNSNTRHDALLKISDSVGRSLLDVDKKIRNLRSQFLREKNKVTKSQKSGAGTDEVYVPKWAFYKSLLFLSPSVEPVSHSSSMNINLPQGNFPENEIDDSILDDPLNDHDVEDDLAETPPSAKSTHSNQRIPEKRSITKSSTYQSPPLNSNKRFKPKNKTDAIEKKLDEAYEIMKSSANKKKDQDTCFGEFVAESLRNVSDPRIKSWARREISNILYQAETGINDSYLSTNPNRGSLAPQLDNRVGYRAGTASNQYIQQPHQRDQAQHQAGYFNPYDTQYVNFRQQTTPMEQQNSQNVENLNDEHQRPSSI